MESAFGGYTSSYLILALHSQIFDCLRELFTDILGVPRIGSFRKKCLFLRKRLSGIANFEGPWLVGICFRH